MSDKIFDSSHAAIFLMFHTRILIADNAGHIHVHTSDRGLDFEFFNILSIFHQSNRVLERHHIYVHTSDRGLELEFIHILSIFHQPNRAERQDIFWSGRCWTKTENDGIERQY